MIVLPDGAMATGTRSPATAVGWGLGKPHRVAGSTLAAESRVLNLASDNMK